MKQTPYGWYEFDDWAYKLVLNPNVLYNESAEVYFFAQVLWKLRIYVVPIRS